MLGHFVHPFPQVHEMNIQIITTMIWGWILKKSIRIGELSDDESMNDYTLFLKAIKIFLPHQKQWKKKYDKIDAPLGI